MILDQPTLLVLAALMVLVAAVVVTAQTWDRPEKVDRCWVLACLAAVATAVSYLAGTLVPDRAWPDAVGNTAFTLSVWATWAGLRALSGRPAGEPVVAAAVTVSFLATVAAGPGHGGPVFLAVIVTGCGAGARAVLTGPLRRRPPALAMAGLLLVEGVLLLGVGALALVRRVLPVGAGGSGPLSAVLGPEILTVVTTVVAAGVAGAMVTLRAGRSGEATAGDFDPATGARTPASFQLRARAQLRQAAETRRPATVAVVVPENLPTLAVAFGRGVAAEALVRCGEAVQVLLPPRALMGRADGEGQAFEVLLPGWTEADARTWAAGLRREVVDTALDLPGGSVRLGVRVGLACAERLGYDLTALRVAAYHAAGGVDRGAGGVDRGAGGVDRGAGGVDRGAGGVDRGPAPAAGTEHRPTLRLRGGAGEDS